ncbi:MAG: aminotransferase class V-fold PLP-dependent enzyme [Mycobacterium leprae]
MIYLDNGATSHPKPETVYTAADQALRAGGNPGRGGHRLALAAGRRVLAAREAVAQLFGLEDSARVLFTTSATDSLNLALKGLLRPGDHVITTQAEHNALRRPLAVLERQGVEVTWLPVSPEGLLNPDSVMLAVRRNTRLIAVSHGSNVTGAVQDLAALGKIARRSHVLLLVDAAQTAGAWPIHMKELGIHLLAAPGHKGLLGPQGTGILLVDPQVALQPIREGGTGSHSADLVQPAIFPEGFESGTLNVAGIAGLEAGVRFLLAEGVEKVQRHEQALATVLTIHLRRIPGVTVYGPTRADLRCGVVCFNIDGLDCGEVEERLDDEYGVIGRAGLHCNPGAHEAVGSMARGGAMRLSPGYFTTMTDIDAAVQAVAALAHESQEGR